MPFKTQAISIHDLGIQSGSNKERVMIHTSDLYKETYTTTCSDTI